MNKIIILCFVFFSLNISAQASFDAMETRLLAEIEAVFDLDRDADKIKAADKFMRNFKQILYSESAFDFPFEKLPVSSLVPPDKSVRVITWNINLQNDKEKYYGLAMIPREKNMVDIVTFQQSNKEIKNFENAQLSQKNWYGAVYYKMIPYKNKGKKYYVLVGWDGYNSTINRKVLEVMTISGKNVRFGSPVFKKNKKLKKRILFEYNEEAVMKINYDKKSKKIIFDHLAPMGNHIDSEKEFYAPDLTSDAYVYKRGKWNFEDNVEFLRPKTEKDNDFNDPSE